MLYNSDKTNVLQENMDAENFNFNNQNQLKTLKESFSEFVTVTNNIKASFLNRFHSVNKSQVWKE